MAMKIIYPALEDYQRRWRTFKIDKNLKDDWLLRLNDLKFFYLTNICEGHATCNDEFSVIVLLARSDFIREFDVLIRRPGLLDGLCGYIPQQTVLKFLSTFCLTNDPDTHFGDHIVKLSLRRETPRHSLQMQPEDIAWFETAVTAVEKIDSFFQKCIEGREKLCSQ